MESSRHVSVVIALPGAAQADSFAVTVTDPVVPLGGEGARIVDEKLGGRLERLAAAGELEGRLGRSLVLHLNGELSAARLVVAGAGPRERVDAEAIRTAAAAAARRLRRVGGSVLWLLDESLPVPAADQAAALVEGTILGSYSAARWKTEGDLPRPIEQIVIGHFESDELRAAVERAALVAEHANSARDLANAPPNELTPARLAEHAERLAAEHERLTAEWLGP